MRSTKVSKKFPYETEKQFIRERLNEEQADAIEAEMRQMELDPSISKTEMRLFMQSCMPCGHAVGNLLTCDQPPFGCVICNSNQKRRAEL